jgi:hypothetical protein
MTFKGFDLVSIGKRFCVFCTVFALALITQIQKDGRPPRTWTDLGIDALAALIAGCPIGQDPTGFRALGVDALQAVQAWLTAPAARRAQVARDREASLIAQAKAAGAKALTEQLVRTPGGLMTLAKALEQGFVAFAPAPAVPPTQSVTPTPAPTTPVTPAAPGPAQVAGAGAKTEPTSDQVPVQIAAGEAAAAAAPKTESIFPIVSIGPDGEREVAS